MEVQGENFSNLLSCTQISSPTSIVHQEVTCFMDKLLSPKVYKLYSAQPWCLIFALLVKYKTIITITLPNRVIFLPQISSKIRFIISFCVFINSNCFSVSVVPVSTQHRSIIKHCVGCQMGFLFPLVIWMWACSSCMLHHVIMAWNVSMLPGLFLHLLTSLCI